MGQLKNKKLDKAVGSRISEFRQKAGFDTSIKFAERYNFDHQTLRSMESGHVTINAATLKWFAETLKVSSDYLLGISRAPSLDDSVQSIFDKYGLEEASLKTLSYFMAAIKERIADEKNPNIEFCYPREPGWGKPLTALNAILSNYSICNNLLYLIHAILFEEIHDRFFTLSAYKDGILCDSNLGYLDDLDADMVRELQLVTLHRLLEKLRGEFSDSNDDTKPKNKSKPTTQKKGAENGGN